MKTHRYLKTSLGNGLPLYEEVRDRQGSPEECPTCSQGHVHHHMVVDRTRRLVRCMCDRCDYYEDRRVDDIPPEVLNAPANGTIVGG